MADANSDAMWKSYIQVVAGFAGVTSDSKSSKVFFPATTANTGITAGAGVPQAITNELVYEAADALLKNDSIWYNPKSTASYALELSNYLDHVDLAKDSSDAAKAAIVTAQAALDRAKAAFDKARRAANADYTEFGEGANKALWISANAPDVFSAWSTMTAATNQVNIAQAKVSGQGATVLGVKRDNVTKAITGGGPTPDKAIAGITMPTKEATQIDLLKYATDIKAGRAVTITEPTDVSYKPVYNLDVLYGQTLNEWFSKFDTAPDLKNETLSVSKGSQVNTSSFGHTTTEAEKSVGLFGWFRVKYNKTDDWAKGESVKTDSSTTVQFKAKDVRLFNVSPGGWDVPGYRRLYPNTTNLPESAKNVVQVTQLLCASGVSLSIKFGADTQKDFDEKWNRVSAGGGSISIFGIEISASGNTSEGTNTHTMTRDSTGAGITIQPTNLLGTSTLLGVVGAKFEAGA